MKKQHKSFYSILLVALSIGGILAIWDGAASAFQFQVYGKIGEKWQRLGQERGPLGAARSSEADAPHGGRFNEFAAGSIWWHPTIGEAYAVWGAIGVKYRQLGGPNFGYPITDELTTPDGVGRFNHFRSVHVQGKPEASIYWTPSTGAHEVYGGIRKAWAEQGWERGKLGYPTSGEFQVGPDRRQNFQNGYIHWSAQGGPSVVLNAPSASAGPQRFDTSTDRVYGLELVRDPGRNVLVSNPNFLSPQSLCGYLDKDRARLEQLALSMINTLNSSGRLPSGVKIVRPEIRISQACTAEAAYLNNGIQVSASLRRNVVLFNLTTPSLLGQWADPRFSIDFDVNARSEIRIPATVSGGLSVGPTQLSLTNMKLDSQNATGDIARAGAQIWSVFSGRDFIGALTRDRSFQLDEIGVRLGQLNRGLTSLGGGLYIVTTLDPRTHLLTLQVTDRLPRGPIVR